MLVVCTKPLTGWMHRAKTTHITNTVVVYLKITLINVVNGNMNTSIPRLIIMRNTTIMSIPEHSTVVVTVMSEVLNMQKVRRMQKV